MWVRVHAQPLGVQHSLGDCESVIFQINLPNSVVARIKGEEPPRLLREMVIIKSEK